MARFKNNAQKFKKEMSKKAQRNMQNVTAEYRKDLQEEIWNKAPTGRWYNITPYGLHQASAPGEPPAKLSGDLWKSIAAYTEATSRGFVGKVQSDVAYSTILELGGGRIAPRPAWMPALLKNWDKYRKIATVDFKRR